MQRTALGLGAIGNGANLPLTADAAGRWRPSSDRAQISPLKGWPRADCSTLLDETSLVELQSNLLLTRFALQLWTIKDLLKTGLHTVQEPHQSENTDTASDPQSRQLIHKTVS